MSDRSDPAVTRVRAALDEGIALRQELMAQAETIAAAGALVADALRAGGKLLVCGNGGSAADAQHIASELTGRYIATSNRPGLAAVALTTDSSALTAIANDFGYEQVFARQIEALGKRGDVLLAISTSGNSRNVVEAAKRARAHGLRVIALTGASAGLLGPEADVVLCTPGRTADRIQELHITIGHILCSLIEAALF